MEKVTIGAGILCAPNEEFIDLTIQSLIQYVDEILIVGDPNKETMGLIMPFVKNHPDKVRLIWKDWDGDYGNTRKYLLNYLNSNFSNLVIVI